MAKERKEILATVIKYCGEKMKGGIVAGQSRQHPHFIVWNDATNELVEIEKSEPSPKVDDAWGGAKQW